MFCYSKICSGIGTIMSFHFPIILIFINRWFLPILIQFKWLKIHLIIVSRKSMICLIRNLFVQINPFGAVRHFILTIQLKLNEALHDSLLIISPSIKFFKIFCKIKPSLIQFWLASESIKTLEVNLNYLLTTMVIV